MNSELGRAIHHRRIQFDYESGTRIVEPHAYGGDECAHRIAWAAVKRKYRRANGIWVPIKPAW